MKIINFLLAIIFLVFAFLKINGTEPIPFILMYGAMSVICIMAMFQLYYKWLIVIVTIPILYYAASVHLSAREWIHSGGVVNHEEASDFFQLAFAVLVLVIQGFRSFRRG